MIKKAIIWLSLMVLPGAVWAISDAQLKQLSKEIDMLESILRQSLQSEEKKRRLSISGKYLAHQGIMIEIKANLRSRVTVSGISYGPDFDLMDIEIPEIVIPKPPEVPADLSSLERQHWYREAQKAQHQAMNAQIEARQDMMRAAQDRREVSIRKRNDDIRALREADQESLEAILEYKLELEELKQKLGEAKLEKDEKKSQKLKIKMAKLEKKLKQKQKKRADRVSQRKAERKIVKEKLAAAEQQQLNQIQTNIIAALCDFGNAIKSLPKDQYVSFLVNRKRAGDYVFVVKKSDIERCVRGKINAEQMSNDLIQYALQ